MKLYMIRHGETAWNKERKLQGHSDIPLNENGCALAEATGKALANISFDYVFSSPLTRAVQTAELVLNERKLPIQTDERIKEIGFGEYEGICMLDEFADPEFEKFFVAPEQYQPPKGGETIEHVRQRTGAFLKELAENPEYEDKTILIATHGAAIKGLITNITGEPISDYWRGGVHKNCAVSIAECHSGVYTLISENHVYY